MNNTFINKTKVSIKLRILLLVLFSLIVFSTIKGYGILQFFISLVFCWIAIKVYLKFKAKTNKIEIESGRIKLYDSQENKIFDQKLENITFDVFESNSFNLNFEKKKYFLDLGSDFLNFQKLVGHEKFQNKKQKKTSIFNMILDLIYIFK